MRWHRASAALCGSVLRLAACAVACGAGVAPPAAATDSGVPVRIDVASEAAVTGGLCSIDADAIELVVDGARRRIDLGAVRAISVVADGAGIALPVGRSDSYPVEVVGDGGLVIGADDLRWEGGQATLVRGNDAIELPIGRVRRATWRTPGGGVEWLQAVPAEPAADLVAVARPEGFELVECAIAAISPTAVTVVLDGERIPVSRRKVLGLVWVRPAPDTTATMRSTPVVVDGGAVTVATIAWRDGAVVLDGEIRLPERMLRSIDFAAGRTVPLVAIEPEASAGEPFFGGLAEIDGLGAFFAPRIVSPDEGRPAWLMRPRASATWRVPEGSRRFRARAVSAAASGGAGVVVWARADDGQEWRQPLEAVAEIPVDIDVRDARRLTLGVDFSTAGVGMPVRFDDAGFEK